MDTRASEHVKIAEQLFTKRQPVDSLWQVIAENFYVERADFTTDRSSGEEFAEHLFGSFPVLARRELGDAYSANLRPRALTWFTQHTSDEELDKDREVRAYLEYRSKVHWRAVYDPASQFVGATKSTDHDFAAFGNAVLEVSPNRNLDGLLHRCRHLRDCAWLENADGAVDTLYMKWNPTARQLAQQYPTKVSTETLKAAKDAPSDEIPCLVMSLPRRSYEGNFGATRREFPWTYVVVEKEAETVLEEIQEDWFRFVVPRSHRVTGSVYARSPAAEIALPDGKTFQVVTRTIREAGEMAVNPPMISFTDALRSDAELYPGGMTSADLDAAGDRNLDDIMAPVVSNPGAMPIGLEILQALKEDLSSAWFLDKIRLPDIDSKVMTAYEFQKRLEQYIRQSAPMYEPVLDEYNSPMVELQYRILSQFKAFGPDSAIPEILSGQQVEFKFRSPLTDIQDQAKAGMFTDMMERLLVPAAQIDPALMATVDVPEALRDSVQGLGVPATWMGKEGAVEAAQAAMAEQQKMQAGIEALGQGGEAAQSVGAGAMAIEEAMGDAA